jgi:hypothetical protein
LLLILRILWGFYGDWGGKGKISDVDIGVGGHEEGKEGGDEASGKNSKIKKPEDEGNKWGNFFGDLFKGGGEDVKAETGIDTRFSDVLGIDEFKEELEELVGMARFFFF